MYKLTRFLETVFALSIKWPSGEGRMGFGAWLDWLRTVCKDEAVKPLWAWWIIWINRRKAECTVLDHYILLWQKSNLQMEELQRNIIQEELVKEWPKALNSDITSVIDSVIYHFVQMNSVVPAVQMLVTFKDKWTQGKFVWPCVVQPLADLHTTAAQNEGTATTDLKQSIKLQSH